MVRITKDADYAIVLLARIANHDEGEVLTARGLAEQTGLPAPMVSKILKALTRGGLLVSHRGSKGGYSLVRRLDEISVADVIKILEGPISLTECWGEGPEPHCGIEKVCPVRSPWSMVNQAIWRTLSDIPLAEMVYPFSHYYQPRDGARSSRTSLTSPTSPTGPTLLNGFAEIERNEQR